MQRHFQCVIPCGGNSSRMDAKKNKCLLTANGRTILWHVVDFWKLHGIEDFIFIVGGNSADEITNHIYNMCNNPIIINRQNISNLMKAVKLAEEYIDDAFILALGDCVNFGEFVNPCEPLGVGLCIAEDDELEKSYLVQIDSYSITRMIEKPLSSIFGLCGMGTLFLDKRIFQYIKRLSLPDYATSVDFTGVLQLAIGEGEVINPVFFKGDYINVTYPRDIPVIAHLARLYSSMKITSKELCC